MVVEAIKIKMIEQQRRNTRSLRRRAALVIRSANNNHSGRSPSVRFGATTSFSLFLFRSSRGSPQRSLHSNKDRPLALSRGPWGGQSATSTAWSGRPARGRKARRGQKKIETKVRGRCSHGTRHRGCRRAKETYAERQMRRKSEKEGTKWKNERDAEKERKEEQRKKREYRRENERSEREVWRTHMREQRTIENIKQDGERGDVTVYLPTPLSPPYSLV